MRGYGAGINLFTPGRFLFRDGLYVVIGYHDIDPKTALELSLSITAPICSRDQVTKFNLDGNLR